MKTKLFTTALVIFFSAFMLAAANTAKGKEARLVSSLENAIDPSVKVENWMFNDAFWNMEATTHFTQDFDASLALENWMSDVETWDAFSLAMAETDETLKLEDWMTNDNLWINEAVFTENEEALQLEDWMTNDKMWISEEILETATDEKLVIESWMTDEKYWNLPEGR